MLRTRLIPSILLKNGRMIKPKQFEAYRDVGDPRTVARLYNAQLADELLFLDVNAPSENRGILFDVIKSVAEECFIPLTVGGGVKTVAHARDILQRGADKVSINSAAVDRPELITDIAKRFGRSTVVVSIDYKKNVQGKNEVFTCGGLRPTGLDPVQWAKQAERKGAGEIFLTSIDREGIMEGYDLQTIRTVADAVSIPVIAHGGVGSLHHFVEGVILGHASAVSAGSIFNFTDQSVFKAHAHMKEHGLSVRLT